MRYTIPLISDEDVTLEGPFPLSEKDWHHFVDVLKAMRPGLVRADSESPEED